MLDQNTDRMWYVIGALVVGAGIILLANKAMPELFASVADSFHGVSSSVEDTIYSGMLDYVFVTEDMLAPTKHAVMSIDESDGSILVTASNELYDGIEVRPGQVDGMGWEPNTQYRVEYILEPYEGPLSTIQHEVPNVSYNLRRSYTYIDGVRYSLQEPINLDTSKSSYTIELIMTTSKEILPKNAFVIRPNGWLNSPTTVRISDLRIQKE